MSSTRRTVRRYINVVIKLIDAESDIHKYRVLWTSNGSPVAPFVAGEIVEFTANDTIPLKQLLALVPGGYYIRSLQIRAPFKLLPIAPEKLRGTLILNLHTANCPTWVVKPRIQQLVTRMDHLRYWPEYLAPRVQNLVRFACVHQSRSIKAPDLLILYHLDQLVKCGLAASSPPLTPWSIFLTKGLYDPRLLLHIVAFVL